MWLDEKYMYAHFLIFFFRRALTNRENRWKEVSRRASARISSQLFSFLFVSELSAEIVYLDLVETHRSLFLLFFTFFENLQFYLY